MNLTEIDATQIHIGNSAFPFTSYAEASDAYRAAIDATDATCTGMTGPLAPPCQIVRKGQVIAYISYNGRVWRGDGRIDDRIEDQERLCLYNPYENAAGAE